MILIGSDRTENTIKELDQSKTETIFIKKDFRKAYETSFFDEITKAIDSVNGNISGLINNVGYRVGWNPYHESPRNDINDSIVVGTIVQAQLTRICIPYFLKRDEKSFNNHLIHLFIHSFLHLLGYDHQTEDKAKIMERLEVKILENLKIDNPYE